MSDGTTDPGRPMMPGWPTLPLLPRHRIPLAVRDGDGPRFVRQFRETWRQIPVKARRQLLRFWRQTGPSNVAAYQPPEIVLVDGAKEGAFRVPGDPVRATCQHRGRELVFRAEMFEVLPDHVARCIIAHELAHVLQWALAFRTGNDVVVTDDEESEDDADDTASRWGFDIT